MAKAKNAGLFQQHAEKGAVAISLLLLAYAIIQWALSSSVTFTTPQGEIPPQQVDQYLKDQAEGLWNAWQAAKPPEKTAQGPDVEKYRRRLDALMTDPIPVALLRGVDVTSPAMAQSGPAAAKPLDVTLADLTKVMPKPGKPKIRVRRVLPRRDTLQDENDAFGVAIYPLGELTQQWTELLKPRIVPSPIFQAVEVQIEQRMPDGSWGNAKILESTAPPRVGSTGQPAPVPTVPAFDGKNAADVSQAQGELKADETQAYVLQPEFEDMYWADTAQWVTWRVYLPENSLIHRGTLTGETPAGEAATPRPAAARPAVPAMGGGGMGPDMGGMGAPGGGMGPPGGGMGPPGGGMGPPGGGMGPGTPATPKPTPVVVKPAEAPVELPVPPIVKPFLDQRAAGELLVWFRDNHLDSGRELRYRVRLVVVNPLLLYDQDVKNVDDARIPVVRTEWSDWSDRVLTPGATEFFFEAAGVNTPSRVSVFTSALGRVFRQSVTIVPGDPIGKAEDRDVPNPLEPTTKTRRKVDFSTGAVVVSLDFSKTIFSGGMAKQTVELLYVDANGELKSRILSLDQSSPRYKELKQKAEKKP